MVSQNRDLKEELATIQANSIEVFSILQNIHKAMMAGAVVGAREWQYLNALNLAMEELIKTSFSSI